MRNAFLAATPLAVLEIPVPAGKVVILRGYLADDDVRG